MELSKPSLIQVKNEKGAGLFDNWKGKPWAHHWQILKLSLY